MAAVISLGFANEHHDYGKEKKGQTKTTTQSDPVTQQSAELNTGGDLIDADIAAIEAEPEILAAKSASSSARHRPRLTGASSRDISLSIVWASKNHEPHTCSVLGSLCFEAQENLLCPRSRDSRVDGCVACFELGGTGRGSQPDLSAIPGTFPFGYSTYSLPSMN